MADQNVGGYPGNFFIENSVLALVEHKNGPPYCNMGLVTLLYGIALTECVSMMSVQFLIEHEVNAVFGSENYDSKKRARIREVRDEYGNAIVMGSPSKLAYIKLYNRREEDEQALQSGFDEQISFVGYYPPPKYIVYGHYENGYGPAILEFDVGESVILSQSFPLNLDNVNIQGMNLVGAIVIIQRRFAAICEHKVPERRLECTLASTMLHVIKGLEAPDKKKAKKKTSKKKSLFMCRSSQRHSSDEE